MTSDGQQAIREHLRMHLIGPRAGEAETLETNPVYTYLTGMLFPVEEGEGLAPEIVDEDLSPEEAELGGDEGGYDDESDDDDIGNLTAATGWTPSSMGLSFIHDAPELIVTARAAVYERSTEPAASGSDGEWVRRDLGDQSIIIGKDTAGQADLWNGLARLQWRSRPGKHHPIVTVALSNSGRVPLGRAKKEVAKVLFQSGFDVVAAEGAILPYPGNIVVNATAEDRELEYRYRNHLSFAIGHGVAATWGAELPVTSISTDSLPAETVPRVKPRESQGETLTMRHLSNPAIATADLHSDLAAFLDDYARWVADRRREVDDAADADRASAGAITDRMDRAIGRMREGIDLLAADETVLRAFRLANLAMRLQALRDPDAAPKREPAWRPFQLAFILLSLASTADATHPDRELVDLIWFPTGGGKTEAYLGLVAFEMIRRRITQGMQGGGTSVITRYTMRLLTAQQFQRAARLICALELLRRPGGELQGLPSFSIGLLLGNSTTPGDFVKAEKQLSEVRGQMTPQNPFQVRTCPWCDTALMPERRSARDDAYGFRAVKTGFTIYCVNKQCSFHDRLPMQVVDEGIYADPPSIVVATVDKFARLAWIPRGGSLFGLDGSPFDPPSLVIQDELHLISGPLGTVVGIYEAAIRSLLAWRGSSPKIVASTATIRSADE
ncbi:MAG: helicase, partial [Actinobacteria bacterium]|nr:helicase [Actinomycetota bacterium]